MKKLSYITSTNAISFFCSGMIGCLLLFILISLSHGTASAQEPISGPSAIEGQALWSENCTPCHGQTGVGDGSTAASIAGPLPDFTDPAFIQEVVPTDYLETIKEGRIENMMPPWKGRFSDEQIWNLIAYVLLLSTSQADLEAGQATYAQNCASCHGENGTGEETNLPDFQDWQSLSQQSLSVIQTAYSQSLAHDDVATMSDDETWQTLVYLRTLAFAQPRIDGILTGQLINRTTDQPMPDMVVKLHLLQNKARLETLTAQTDADGNYTFSDLPTSPLIEYMVEAVYEDIFYLSQEPASFAPAENLLALDVEVYDTTTTDPGINITQLHYLISLSPIEIRIDQIMVVGNSGQETYIGQDGKTFQFTLPAEAEGITFQNDTTGSRFVPTDDGYTDTEPIAPGTEGASIVVTYFIPHDGDSSSLTMPISADVGHVSALMQDQGATLTSDRLEFANKRQIQDQLYSLFTGENLEGGTDFALTISDLDNLTFTPPGGDPSAPAAVASILSNGPLEQTTWLAIIMALGGLSALLAVIFYPTIYPQPENDETKQKRLLLMLVRLDEMAEAGELDETVYHRARAKYKAELIQVIQ
ncbi:c-type cytochrome [Anaerolineales bacterium HSG6]|nr:c-type cytochrome [Anaerolineales bacterium HSG6]